ncbi:TetR/AcrR family transcriptional regulator [Polycladidibacter stylochi]|uniref:TetR/AcrR family transcriptional regulator n=1 Tax=Polycladidibacter stylochi TaxID=1807766 RepID=UPI0008371A95|nr:TetR/AcrR family transcriptional regulator [Pseudovibrio stylochi]
MATPNTSKNKQTKEELRKAALVCAAEQVFFAKGYAASSLDEIIAKSGGSKRNIYNYFGGKAGLLGAVIAKLSEELLLPPLNEKGVECPLQALSKLSQSFVSIIFSQKALSFWRMMIANADQGPDAINQFMQNGPLRAQQAFAKELQRASESGQLDIDDPTCTAAELLALLRGQQHVECLIGFSQLPTNSALQQHAQSTLERFIQNKRKN